MDKVILKAFLSTLLAIVILLVCMVAALCLIFPSTMMGLTYSLGMNACSVHFAKSAYERSGDVTYIAFATEVSIYENDGGEIYYCGTQFIGDDEFETYCQSRNQNRPQASTLSYEQYVYGKVYANGYTLATTIEEKKRMIDKSFDCLPQGTFPRNNAAVATILAVLAEDNAEALSRVREKMAMLAPTVSLTDMPYYLEIAALIA